MNEQVSVSYELALTAEEARQGVTKRLSRNAKNIQVNIPAGVVTGSTVKLTNALQTTDGKPGDILIKINVKAEQFSRPAPAGVVEIGDNTFEKEVLSSELPVVVDFWAPWCGPCRMMAPIMDKAAADHKGKIKFCKINVDENPQMAGQYQAMSIPMLLFFKNGQIIDRVVGAVPESQLMPKLNSLI